jgi:DNA-directed RNA polymerase subunit RPC12/RpoP
MRNSQGIKEKKKKIIRYNYCPHCESKIIFKIGMDDIDTKQYPAPIYIIHKDPSCGKLSTFYVDSLLRVSYKELEKKPGAITTIETEN